MKRFGLSLGKGVLWALFTLVFGLLQLWIILARDAVLVSPEFNFNQMILSGTLLFFASAVVSAICIDYYLGRSGDMHRILVGFVYFIYPMGIMTLCVFLFAFCFTSSTNPSAVNVSVVKTVQSTVLIMTIVYAVFTKTVMYFQEGVE